MTSSSPDQIPDRRHFDAIVIGSGSGGLTVAVGLGRFGRHVLLVERDQMGGDCTNTGCIPSKALLHETAVRSGAASADPAAILSTVRTRRDDLRHHEVEEFGGAEGVTFVYGTAALRAGGRVSITHGDGTVWLASADHVVIATGSSPRRLDLSGLEDDAARRIVLTNEDLFEITEPPSHLAIIGGGAIGLEMALAFRRLGSEVTVVEMAEQVLPGTLPQAASLITDALVGQGVSIRTGAQAAAYRADGGRLELAPAESSPGSSNGASATIEGVDRILMAVGRTPNSGGLGLDEVGADLDDRGSIVIDDRGRTSVGGLWAVGDVTDRGGTTHYASIWGRRIIQSIVYPYLPVGDEPLRPTVTFTDPEVATIGVQPVEPPPDVLRISVDGAAIDRSYTDRSEHGLLVVDVRPPTGDVLGATIVGPRAGEIITTFSLAMKTGIAFHRWYGTVIPYPTYSDVITKAVDQYLSETADDVTGHVGRWATGLWGRTRNRLTN